MKDKHILGLDLGTNSIGWAMVNASAQENYEYIPNRILDAGCRIIPMDASVQGDFAKGNSISQTAERTRLRGTRRLIERRKLRRERMNRILNKMGFLPSHYSKALNRYGQFINNETVLLPWANGNDGKPHFIFQSSYNEMLQKFYTSQPKLIEQGMKVPYDWTLYYLRTKALKEPIRNDELAWILLQFNQKRGYYQTRSEQQDEDKSKQEEFHSLKVIDVQDSGDKKGKKTWWNVQLENDMIYRCALEEKPNWIGMVKDFIVSTQLNEDGTPKQEKDGTIKRSISMPQKDDWNLAKIKTQHDIKQTGLTVGEYIFNALLNNPKQKIIGQLVRTIERDFYKEELKRILKTQIGFNPILQDRLLYQACIEELYPQNHAYRHSISNRDFTYLLLDDILFYQRPLKSKKSLIDECPYESNHYIDNEGNHALKPLRCTSKSHPKYQEFRLWQFISNLRIYQSQKGVNGRILEDADVTNQFLPNEDAVVSLFDYLNDLKEIDQKTLLTKHFKVKVPKGTEIPYRWNYVEDKKYPCNSTRSLILDRLKKVELDTSFINGPVEEQLWHILYSVTDTQELRKALTRFAKKIQNSYNSEHPFNDDFAYRFTEAMATFPPFESSYGAYSLKALNRLLPLMRLGKYWCKDQIDSATLNRIQCLINGEVEEHISLRVREKTASLTSIEDFRGLPVWMACYVVYNRHSETTDTEKWSKPEDIDLYLHQFRQHSLRNPIVEQVVTETLRTVRDIWKKHGHIDEIHLEMGREIKNSADKRAEITKRALKNEAANLRIKALLLEFMNPEYKIENVRPHSPSQQEILRIYEETVLGNTDSVDEEIDIIIKKFSEADVEKRPTPREIMRYKLWLEQRYVSPYTGQPIPLARLFTPDYEIEHIIPQSRYFDDSLSNKVICESEVNKLKDNALGYEFIKKHYGEKVQLNGGRIVTIFDEEQYSQHIAKTYKQNRIKMKKLLMEDIPADFIERQLNDSRYISKFIKGLLSKIVRTEDEHEAISKNLIICNGNVTDRLKQDWGVNEVWNRIILPRFERMNQLTESKRFTTLTTQGHLIPDMPLNLQKGFSKKRIDHRHHAMDAIVIACTTRQHVNLLSNESAADKNNTMRHQLSRKLRRYEDVIIDNGKREKRSVPKEFILPWSSFPTDVHQALEQIIVSFKQNLRVINKTTNYNVRFVNGKKQLVNQTTGQNWAVRKPMHKDIFFGKVNLRKTTTIPLKEALLAPTRILNTTLKKKIKELITLGYNEKQIKTYFTENAGAWKDVNLKKIEAYQFSDETDNRYFATRKPIDNTFDKDKICHHVTDTGIQKIMLAHLGKHKEDSNKAFSPEGIEEMNRNITHLNGGKPHQPIYRVRWYEKANKFAVGQTGNKSQQFVEGDKGTNLFFVVKEVKETDKITGKETPKRKFSTLSFNEAIIKMKQNMALDEEASFILSPGDLVYVPNEDEIKNNRIEQPTDKNRIYKMVSSSGKQVYFVQANVASSIQDKYEFSSLNKMERAITGEMIKEICIPIKVDRLGNIIKIGGD